MPPTSAIALTAAMSATSRLFKGVPLCIGRGHPRRANRPDAPPLTWQAIGKRVAQFDLV